MPADRAVSEATLAGFRPAVAQELEVKPDFIAAARRAAQASREATPMTAPAAQSEIAAAADKLAKRVGRLRALLGSASVIVLVLMTAQIRGSLLAAGDSAAIGLPAAAGTPTVAKAPAPASADAPSAAASATPSPVEPRCDVLRGISGTAIALLLSPALASAGAERFPRL